MTQNGLRITKQDPADATALYHRYPGQTGPQDAFIAIDRRDGEVYADWNGEIGNAVPHEVWSSDVIRLALPAALLPTAANRLMARLVEEGLVARILLGADAEADQGAYDPLDDACEDARRLIEDEVDEDDLVVAWDAGEYWAADPPVVAADATDADLATQAAECEAFALAYGVHVLDGIVQYLERRRDEAREAASRLRGVAS